MQRIKILHITQSVGGVETYLKQVVSTIDHSRFELKIIGTISPFLEPYCRQYNVAFTRVSMARGLNPITDIRSIIALKKIIKKEDAACAHLHSAKGGFIGRIACRLAGQRSLFTPHALSYLSFSGAKRRLFFLLEKFAQQFTDKVLAISNSEAERLVNDLHYKPADIFVIPNSLIIEDFFYHSNDDSRRYQLAGEIKIGTIGRLTPQKNPLLFIDVAKELIRQTNGKAHFYFLGVGEHDHLKAEADKKISECGIEQNIHMLERGNLQTSIHFLQQLDAFLFPSVFEGLSYALLEAMLQGVPCVVSNVDGNKDVITNAATGYTCNTLKEYVDALTILINNPVAAKELGENARKFVVEHHNLKKNIHYLEEVYTGFATQSST